LKSLIQVNSPDQAIGAVGEQASDQKENHQPAQRVKEEALAELQVKERTHASGEAACRAR
jgi:hypothetical protein